jgi:hypothetical protein
MSSPIEQPRVDANESLRWGVYGLLIALAVGNMTGRILAVNSVDYARLEGFLKQQGRQDWQKQRPFLSANDRSRWATVRALVEHGTYAIDEIVSQPNWDTIDMVKHRGRDGQPHLYSSKPALFPTLLAGEYWLIHKLTGWTLGTHPYEIGRFMLLTVNVLPLAIAFVFLAKLVERLGTSDWGRVFVMAAAAFGTFLTTFAVVINNHLISAVCVTLSLYFTVRIWHDGERRLRYFALAGLFAALTASNELPALAWLALNGVVLLWKAPRQTLLAYTPAVFVVAAAHLGADYAAHGTIKPAYAHRAEGKDWETGNWYNYTYMRGSREITSYWATREGKSKVDQGEDSPTTYALHVLIGHHGIFSLTPIWLLSLAGGLLGLLRRSEPDAAAPQMRPPTDWRPVMLWIGLVSATCLAFYLTRPLADRNYGGTASAFRWVFWFAPLWLIAMLPALDAIRRRGLRVFCLVLLAFSAMSAAYPTWNPWIHPWAVNWMNHLGWLDW